MPNYAYRVRDAAGRLWTGHIEAEGERAAVAALRRRRLYVVSLRPAGKESRIAAKGRLVLRRGVGARELAVFCRQFATLTEAGVPVLTSLDILARQAEHPVLGKALAGVAEDLQAGRTLAEAMRRQNRVFPELLVSMVEAGEVGGTLDTALNRIADHFEREYDIREKVKAAMTYPMILLIVGTGAVGFLVTYVLPGFVGILSAAHVALPLPTRILLGVSEFLRSYWYLVPAAAGGGAYLWRQALAREKARARYDAWLLRLPVFGPLLAKVAVSRFCRTLSTLLVSGVPLIQALDVVKGTTGNAVLARVAETARDQVREGQPLAGPLAASGVIPPMVSRMVAVGEETGRLDAMLEKVAQFYEREVNAAVGRLSAMLEPVLLVIMGAAVGMVIIAILLPMLSVISGTGIGM